MDQAVVDGYNARAPEPADPSACWPWMLGRSAKGYGVFAVRRLQYRAHRVALAIELGRDLLPNEDACHTCDNPPCCNPAHLFAGSRAENQHDKGRKGRAAKGEANGGGGKLTDDDVRVIRTALHEGEAMTSIGARFGVSRTQIGHIKHERQWRHVV